MKISYYRMVRDFHEKFKVPIRSKFGQMNDAQFRSRVGHLMEEIKELENANNNKDYEKILDAYVDIMYVLWGMINIQGIPQWLFDMAFISIHKANMTKTAVPTERDEFDVIKGDNYRPANIKKILYDFWRDT